MKKQIQPSEISPILKHCSNYVGKNFHIEIASNGYIVNYESADHLSYKKVYTDFDSVIQLFCKEYGLIDIGDEIFIGID